MFGPDWRRLRRPRAQRLPLRGDGSRSPAGLLAVGPRPGQTLKPRSGGRLLAPAEQASPLEFMRHPRSATNLNASPRQLIASRKLRAPRTCCVPERELCLWRQSGACRPLFLRVIISSRIGERVLTVAAAATCFSARDSANQGAQIGASWFGVAFARVASQASFVCHTLATQPAQFVAPSRIETFEGWAPMGHQNMPTVCLTIRASWSRLGRFTQQPAVCLAAAAAAPFWGANWRAAQMAALFRPP